MSPWPIPAQSQPGKSPRLAKADVACFDPMANRIEARLRARFREDDNIHSIRTFLVKS
jgi:hypothetical protein